MADRRLPFGLLPQADPRTLYAPRGMGDLIDGGGDAVRPGQQGYQQQQDWQQQAQALQQQQATRDAMQQALRMMLQRDPSLAWGKDGMNPADRQKFDPYMDNGMQNFAAPPDKFTEDPTVGQTYPKMADPATWGNPSTLGPWT